MIDSFQIQVPSVIETEGDFNVTVYALDAQGAVLVDDSTTVIQIIPSDPNIVFDGDGDGTYGEVGDDFKTLTNGVAVFPARDTKAGDFNITATDTLSNTGVVNLTFSFNCLVIPSSFTTPPEGTTFENAYQFFQVRDSIEAAEEDPTLYEIRDLTVEGFSSFFDLEVTFTDIFTIEANDLAQGDGTAVATLTNGSDDLDATQVVAGSRATYNTNEIQGSSVITFDGNDFYDFENEDEPLIRSTRDFTIIIAARLLQSGGVQTVLAQYLNDTNVGGLIARYDGGWELAIDSDGVQPALSLKSGAGSVGQPVFVVMSRSGNDYTLEVDNVLSDSATDAGTRSILETGNLVGARGSDALDYTNTPADFYPSDLLWLKTYANSLTANQKLLEYYAYQDQYTIPADTSTAYISSLESTYDMDLLYAHDENLSAPVLRDYSGNGYNGWILGTPTRGVAGLNTDGGTAFEYEEGDSTLIRSFNATAATAHTFHFWVSSTEIGAATEDRYLFDHETSRLSLFWDVYNGGAGSGNIGFFDTSYKEFGVSLPRDGSTNLITFVFSGATCELYLNGVSQGTLTYSPRTLSESRTTLRSSFDSNLSSGTITMDVVAYKNAAQVGGDVLAIYNAGIV